MPVVTTDMEKPAGYWITLEGIQFHEGVDLHWMQAFPLGTYDHPIHGKIEMTPERAARFAQNVKLNVRGTELDIDYDHKEKDGRAAGWIKDAEAREDGLWIAVSFTDAAKAAIMTREYKYFSPEYVDAWTHPKTQVKHQDVLFGGALTNRPFLKDILPINMSEIVRLNQTGGNGVDRATMESIATRLGVQFGKETSDEDLMVAITVAASADPEPAGDGSGTGEGGETPPTGEQPPAGEQQTTQPIAASELADLKKLAETNPSIALLLKEREDAEQERQATAKRLAAIEAGNRLSEVKLQLSELKTGETALPPVVTNELQEILVTLPKALGDRVVNTYQQLLKVGLVQLGEATGGDRRASKGGETATKRFTDKVEALMKADDKLSYADAAIQASAEDEQLFEMYLTEQAEGVQL
jgi:hypothetical protein